MYCTSASGKGFIWPRFEHRLVDDNPLMCSTGEQEALADEAASDDDGSASGSSSDCEAEAGADAEVCYHSS